ncbi:hypothetical protein ThvES_00011760 [Thiovulum sp. ES]|nr:hypothetical protein ThvES_00011760 [Thiovulum sp. ES]
MKIFFIFKLLSVLLFGEIYILSYKIVTEKNRIFTDSLYLSKPMRAKKYSAVSTISVDGNRWESDRKIINKNRDEILNFLFAENGISIRDFTKSGNRGVSSRTTLLLPPIHISIERGIDEVFITLLKN